MTNIVSDTADKRNFGEILPKFFDISNIAHTSLLHSPPPLLSTRDYTVGKTLHFHSTTLILSKVTLCSFLSFFMSDCLEMLVRVLGFKIVWLGGKYEKMKWFH